MNVVLRQDTLVIGKIAGQLTSDKQGAGPNSKKQVVIVAPEADHALRIVAELGDLTHGLARHQRPVGYVAVGGLRSGPVDIRQPVAVCRDHGEPVIAQQQQEPR